MIDLLSAPTSAAVSDAVSLLAEAFADDPFYQWFVPSGRSRRNTLRSALAATAQGTRLCVVQQGARVVGAMAWHDPQLPAQSHVAQFSHYAWLGLHAVLHPLRVATAARIYQHMLQRRLENAHAPMLVLDLIAVDAAERGRGTGASLLRALFDRADAHQWAIHVETTRPSNLELYQHFDFAPVGDAIIGGDAPPTWCLRRAPRASTHTTSPSS